MNTPKIQLLSVVIPSRGRSRKLARLLESIEEIAHETKVPFEVILVIDGQGDLPGLKTSYPSQALTTDHIGAGPARNLGINAASGDAILFLNDDVILESGFFDAHIQRLNAGHDMVLGNSPWIGHDEPRAFDGFVKHTSAIFNQNSLIDAELYNFKQAWTLNLSVRRSVLDQLDDPFDSELRPIYFEDIEFAHRCFTNEPRVVYCQSARAIHDHRVTIKEYFAREVLLGMMSVVLYDRNIECYQELFECSPSDHSLLARESIKLDARDHARALVSFTELASESMDEGDPEGQASLLYDLHLPIKRRAFRIGLIAMLDRTIPWDHRVEHASDLLVKDQVFGAFDIPNKR